MTRTEVQQHQSERKCNVHESNSADPRPADCVGGRRGGDVDRRIRHGTIAAAAFGAILYSVVTGDSIVGALTNIIGRALTSRV